MGCDDYNYIFVLSLIIPPKALGRFLIEFCIVWASCKSVNSVGLGSRSMEVVKHQSPAAIMEVEAIRSPLLEEMV